MPSRAPAVREPLLDEANERLHELRIELRPGTAAELGDRLLGSARGVVWTRRDHRVVRVADGDDPRAERNVAAGGSVGIPRAVPVLVARADERRDRRDGRLVAEDARADLGVAPHELQLGLVERGLGLPRMGRVNR